MNSVHVKLLSLIIVAITILSFSFVPISIHANQSSNSIQQHILVISDSDSNKTAISLFNDRKIINNENLTITYKDIENNNSMTALINDSSLAQKFNEFWIISEKLDLPAVPGVINHLLSFHLPILIWSSKLDLLPINILNKIGIINCTDEISYDNSIFSFSYSNETSLSLLLNQTLPLIQPQNGSINIADCQENPQAYNILDLNQVNSGSIPVSHIVFTPAYKSNILIFSFLLNLPDNGSDTTSISVSSSNKVSNVITSKSNSILSLNQQLGPVYKSSSVQQVKITNLLSALTFSMNEGWTNTPSINSIFPSSSGNTSPTNQINTGFQFPKIDPQLLSNIYFGSLLIALLGLILFLLKRYWIVFLGFIMGILAVFKVPTRKISVMDVYHNETRQSIIDILNYRKGQGETVRNLARQLQIPLPTLLWHLQILEEFELVAREKVKREVVIIAMDYIEEFDMDLKIFELTFKSDKAKIFYDYLLNLKEGEIFTVLGVVNHTQWSSRTVVRYIVKLAELQIIETTPNKGYKIKSGYFGKLKELSDLSVDF